jgi:hypothetical protein
MQQLLIENVEVLENQKGDSEWLPYRKYEYESTDRKLSSDGMFMMGVDESLPFTLENIIPLKITVRNPVINSGKYRQILDALLHNRVLNFDIERCHKETQKKLGVEECITRFIYIPQEVEDQTGIRGCINTQNKAIENCFIRIGELTEGRDTLRRRVSDLLQAEHDLKNLSWYKRIWWAIKWNR